MKKKRKFNGKSSLFAINLKKQEIIKENLQNLPNLTTLIFRGLSHKKELLCEFWDKNDTYMGYWGELDDFECITPDIVKYLDQKPVGIEVQWKNGVIVSVKYTENKTILRCEPKKD